MTWARRSLELAIVLAVAVVSPACSALVGARCAEGYAICGDRCCPEDGGALDGGFLDGGLIDAAPIDGDVPLLDTPQDGALDDVTVDGSAPDGAILDGGDRDVGDAPPTDVGPPCVPPETFCAGICTDTDSDPEHCERCGNACPSGLCVAGACVGEPVGHVVVIGHDYETSRVAMRRIVGNAVFLARSAPVEVLVYVGDATTASRAGTEAAIDATATELGRSWSRTMASSAMVPTLLDETDVLLVHAQDGASDAELTALGTAWGSALDVFLADGGIVVVLDTASASNDGTHQILEAAGLFTATGVEDVSRTTVMVTVPSDAVVLGVPLSYRGETTTVHFTGVTGGAVVADEDGLPVVVHRTTVP